MLQNAAARRRADIIGIHILRGRLARGLVHIQTSTLEFWRTVLHYNYSRHTRHYSREVFLQRYHVRV